LRVKNEIQLSAARLFSSVRPHRCPWSLLPGLPSPRCSNFLENRSGGRIVAPQKTEISPRRQFRASLKNNPHRFPGAAAGKPPAEKRPTLAVIPKIAEQLPATDGPGFPAKGVVKISDQLSELVFSKPAGTIRPQKKPQSHHRSRQRPANTTGTADPPAKTIA
jgi:hypothetical protein